MSTLLQLRTRILSEAGQNQNSGTQFLAWVNALINERLLMLTEGNVYHELRMPNVALTITSDEQSSFDLPEDFRLLERVEFNTDPDQDVSWYPLRSTNDFSSVRHRGFPRLYYLAGNSLILTPYTEVETTQGLRITYIKRPTELSLDADEFPVRSIEASVVQEVVARVKRYFKDPQDAQIGHALAARDQARSIQ